MSCTAFDINDSACLAVSIAGSVLPHKGVRSVFDSSFAGVFSNILGLVCEITFFRLGSLFLGIQHPVRWLNCSVSSSLRFPWVFSNSRCCCHTKSAQCVMASRKKRPISVFSPGHPPAIIDGSSSDSYLKNNAKLSCQIIDNMGSTLAVHMPTKRV